MTLSTFTFTDRARPLVQLGVGDTRSSSGQAQWDRARWDQPASRWSSVEPSWLDVSCDVRSVHIELGRKASTDRFVVGSATIVVDNATGWADPNAVTTPGVLTMRPGRAVRVGIVHQTLGTHWLFRGFVDGMTPTYLPTDTDTVQLDCIDALGEVNRARVTPLTDPIGDGDTIDERLGRVLDLAVWPNAKRALDPVLDDLIGSTLGGQVADLLGQAADSGGGHIFGDVDGNVVFRGRGWLTYNPNTTPLDGVIGNVAPTDVCPAGWERPFLRADLATRAIVGRDEATAVTADDLAGQAVYGIEPFARTDLLTKSDTLLASLANRVLRTRSAATAPRIRSVTLDARTADDALDVMTVATPYLPTRYRCRLRYPRGDVFDAVHMTTGLVHDIGPRAWRLLMNLDLSEPYASTGGRWDAARWDRDTWAADAP